MTGSAAHSEGSDAAVPVFVPRSKPLAPTWAKHLRVQVPDGWRPGEWDPETWIFEPDCDNPRTQISRCLRRDCEVAVANRGFCTSCAREAKAEGLTLDEIANVPCTRRTRVQGFQRYPLCLISDRTQGCQREAVSRGLCERHYSAFHAELRHVGPKTALALNDFLQRRTDPLEALPECCVGGCVHDGLPGRYGACKGHLDRARRLARETGSRVEDELLASHPFVRAFGLPLIGLQSPLREEFLFALYTFDATRRLSFDAAHWVLVFRTIERAGVSSILERSIDQWLAERSSTAGDRHLWRHVHDVLRRERGAFDRTKLEDGLLDPSVLDLTYHAKRPNKSLRHRQSMIDFRAVSQPWLREALTHWVFTNRPWMEDVRRAERLARVLSPHLRATLPESENPRSLNAGTMDALVGRINAEWSSRKTQENYLATWWKIVSHARRHGIWSKVPDGFARETSHRADGPSTFDLEDPGRALPDAVVRRLVKSLPDVAARLTRGNNAGWDAETRGACYVAMLTVLVDTGRRPGEVVSLRDDAVRPDIDGTSWVLKWDNHKAKRHNRTLPIASDTAAAVEKWRALKTERGIHSRWLFPSPVSPENAVSVGTLSRAVQHWVAITPPLPFPVTGLDGVKIDFDLGTVVPYSFRHTYAQRHADAGVEPDVLRTLMDHRSLNTTMGYYRVDAKRRREAAAAVSAFSVDRHGRRSPLGEARLGIASSVPVPFGSCIEPSNVQAGGTACVMQYQCSGCDHFRPDPSHIPAMNNHVHGLLKSASTARAMGSPEHMVVNFEGQAREYAELVESLERQIEDLPEEEREVFNHHLAVTRASTAAQAMGRKLQIMPMPTEEDV